MIPLTTLRRIEWIKEIGTIDKSVLCIGPDERRMSQCILFSLMFLFLFDKAGGGAEDPKQALS